MNDGSTSRVVGEKSLNLILSPPASTFCRQRMATNKRQRSNAASYLIFYLIILLSEQVRIVTDSPIEKVIQLIFSTKYSRAFWNFKKKNLTKNYS